MRVGLYQISLQVWIFNTIHNTQYTPHHTDNKEQIECVIRGGITSSLIDIISKGHSNANISNEADDNFDFKDILMADTVSPEDENLKEIFWKALFEALDELPENQKNVFVWNLTCVNIFYISLKFKKNNVSFFLGGGS
jgi:DNA-directed RNA polymerase specialized sigma24 family protein